MGKLKTLLVDLAWRHGHDPLVSLGSAGLLAALLAVMPGSAALMPVDVRRRGTNGREIAAAIARRVRTDAPEVVVGFGAYVWNDHLVRDTITALRDLRFPGRIVVGGPQVTYGTALDAAYLGADVFVRGHAEQALPIVVSDGGRGFAGVQHRGEPDTRRPCAFDLAACPSPYLSGVLRVHESQSVVRWETQRGCPFPCAYCQHGHPDLRIAPQIVPLERLEAEIAMFSARRVREIKVLDPVFNRGNHALRVLEVMKAHRLESRLSLQCRPELLTDSFVAACEGLDVVIEIGVQTIHPNEGRLVDRPVDISRISRACEFLSTARLDYEATIIFGLPGQTVESFRQTVDFLLGQGVPRVRAFPLMLLAGSALYGRRDELALRTGPGPMPTVIGSPTFDEQDIATMKSLARALELTAGQHPRTVGELTMVANRLKRRDR